MVECEEFDDLLAVLEEGTHNFRLYVEYDMALIHFNVSVIDATGLILDRQ